MKNEMRSQAFLRKRKMLLILPLLALPFVTLAFWALGGGKRELTGNGTQTAGLNLNLPSSNTKVNGTENKLSFYDKASKDSAKMEEWMRNDPYYRRVGDTTFFAHNKGVDELTPNTTPSFKQQLNPSPHDGSETAVEEKLMQKLSQLQTEINKPAETNNTVAASKSGNVKDGLSNDVDRLEAMMQDMSSSESEDPEIKQLSNTLDKILDIQHPDRVKDRLKSKSLQQKEAAFPVNKKVTTESISLISPSKTKISAAFYGLEENQRPVTDDNAVEAAITTNQTIVSGAVVQMRLADDVFINGRLVPNGTPVNGIATLNDERLHIEIKTIKWTNSILPVKLQVYDMDGLEGVYIPDAISRDVAKQSVDNNLQLLELSTMDPSLKAQAASAGVSAAKSLLSRKVKQVRVTLKAGYKLLLKNTEY